MSDGNAVREMTLAEWVDKLPAGHLARKQYSEMVAVFSAKEPTPTPSLLGFSVPPLCITCARHQKRKLYNSSGSPYTESWCMLDVRDPVTGSVGKSRCDSARSLDWICGYSGSMWVTDVTEAEPATGSRTLGESK